MNKKLYEIFQNVRSNPKKTAKLIYDLAIRYSEENQDYDISIYGKEDQTDHDGVILSFLTLIDQNLSDSNITTKYLTKVVEHITNFELKDSKKNKSSESKNKTSLLQSPKKLLSMSSDQDISIEDGSSGDLAEQKIELAGETRDVDLTSSESNAKCCEIDNFYVSLSIKYLRELYITSENIPDRIECHEKAISNIHKILIEKDLLEREQSALINELKDNLSITKKATSRKSKKLVEISTKLKEKDDLDNKQNELIEKLDKNLLEKEQVDNMQNIIIEDLKAEIEKKASLDEYQSDLIEKMQENLVKKDEVDKKQSMLLLKLREELIEKELMDLEQSQSIYKLETIIANHQTQIDALSKKIDFLDKFTIKNELKFGSVCVKIYFLFALCIILNILTVIYFCLK